VTRKLYLPLILALLAPPSWAIDIGRMPDGNAYNAALGALEVANGGTPYYGANVAAGSVQVTSGPSRLVRTMWNGSTTAVVSFFDDSDGTCNTLPRTPPFTVPSLTVVTVIELGMDFANGICMLVATASDAEIAVVSAP